MYPSPSQGRLHWKPISEIRFLSKVKTPSREHATWCISVKRIMPNPAIIIATLPFFAVQTLLSRVTRAFLHLYRHVSKTQRKTQEPFPQAIERLERANHPPTSSYQHSKTQGSSGAERSNGGFFGRYSDIRPTYQNFCCQKQEAKARRPPR